MVPEMLKICLDMLYLEPFQVYNLFFIKFPTVKYPYAAWEDNIQTEIQQMLS